MKSKKILLIISMALIIVMSITNFVYADNCEATASTNKKTNYQNGETVVLKISLNNIESENGIYELEGNLEYEKIQTGDDGKTDQIKSLNGWEDVTFNSETNKFSLRTTTPTKDTQEIMEISLKLKDDIEEDSSIIMLNNLVASNGQDDIELSTVTTNIKIGAEDEDNIIPSITTTPTASTPSSKTPATTPTSTATPSSSKLPQTGIEDNVAPIIFGALIISLVTYVAYRRYKEI